MNLNNLAIPIYEDNNGERWVNLIDLKLAVDSDQYERILRKLSVSDDNVTKKVSADWLERKV